jgi:DNA-binding GntR family transcriptional regulator
MILTRQRTDSAGTVPNGSWTPSLDGSAGPEILVRDANFKFIVYRTLRAAIVEGRLTPGARLVEAALAAQFGISKTPVREALVMLQAENLVYMRPHHGYWVRHLSLAEFSEALFLLDTLEFAALERELQRVTPARLAQARDLAQRMAAAVPSCDVDTYRQAQRHLHLVIHAPEGSPLLADAIARLMDITDRYHRLTIAAHPEQLSLDMERTRARIASLEHKDAQRLIAFIKASHDTLISTLQQAVAADEGGIAALFVRDNAAR